MTKIVHISDIHFKGLSRHQEYIQAFEILFQDLKDKVHPDMVFIGGDLFHTKTSGISPEVVHQLSWMLRKFADLAPTYVILGNHDFSVQNLERANIISSIVHNMNHIQLHLVEHSENRIIELQNKINLGVYSISDKKNWSKVSLRNDCINIAAFHGAVAGSLLDNGTKVLDKAAEVSVGFFKDWDFTFLGDLHTRQYLATRKDIKGIEKPWIAYPGSFVQQNFGEEEIKGVLIWDIHSKEDWDVYFHAIPNLRPFITIPFDHTIATTIDKIYQHTKNGEVLPGSRCRILSEYPLDSAVEDEMSFLLKKQYKVEQVVFKTNKASTLDIIKTGNLVTNRADLKSNPEIIHQLFDQFISMNKEKFQLTMEQVNLGKKKIVEYLNIFQEEQDLVDQPKKNIKWYIKNISFDNLYQYGEENEIDFEKMVGSIGISGLNKTGKSSTIGALMYVLFDCSDRMGITKNGLIMNMNKNECSGRITICVDNLNYLIERSSNRTHTKQKNKINSVSEKTETKLDFYQVDEDGNRIKCLNGNTKTETDKEIRKLIGTPEDFLLTSVAAQSQMERFIEEGPTVRKSILNRFLQLDLFDKLFEFVKKDSQELQLQMANFKPGQWSEIIQTNQEQIEIAEKSIAWLNATILVHNNTIERLKTWIHTHESTSNATKFQLQQLNQVSSRIDNIKKEIEKLQSTINSEQLQINTNVDKLNELLVIVSNINVSELINQMNVYEDIRNELKDVENKLIIENKSLEIKERNIKKLTMVPCGDQYPQCMYIKDAHEDKRNLHNQINMLDQIKNDQKRLLMKFEIFEINEVKEKLSLHKKNELLIDKLKTELKYLNSGMEMKKLRLLELENRLKELFEQKEELGSIENTTEISLINEMNEKQKELKNTQLELQTKEYKRTELLIQLGKLKTIIEQTENSKKEYQLYYQQSKVLDSILAAFHKNGIPAIVLKTQLPLINGELNRLLRQLSNFKIELETEPGSNNMDIFLEDLNSKRIIELGSGAEKMLASIAIRVALINLSSLSKSDIFIIDEGFNALDSEHLNNALSFIQVLKNYFRNVIVISHMDLVKQAVDYTLEVTNDGIYSKISYK